MSKEWTIPHDIGWEVEGILYRNHPEANAAALRIRKQTGKRPTLRPPVALPDGWVIVGAGAWLGWPIPRELLDASGEVLTGLSPSIDRGGSVPEPYINVSNSAPPAPLYMSAADASALARLNAASAAAAELGARRAEEERAAASRAEGERRQAELIDFRRREVEAIERQAAAEEGMLTALALWLEASTSRPAPSPGRDDGPTS